METRTITTVEKEIGAQKLSLETGRVARQAHGAVLVRYGDTVVLATVLSAPSQRDIDFFPLYVDYREMQYAGGKFPGGFFKREGRPSSKEILSCRIIDRTIRPLFPDDFQDEVQIQCIVISADKDHDADVLAMIGSSAALALSHAPFQGPVGAVRLTHVDGQFIPFPTYEQRAKGDFDLVVAGPAGSINMIELGGKEISEDLVAEACRIAQRHIDEIVAMINDMTTRVHSTKAYQPTAMPQGLMELVASKAGDRIRQAKQIVGKAQRNEAVAAIGNEIVAELCPADEPKPKYDPADVRKALYKLEGKIQRELILDGVRPDGRKIDQVRPLSIEVPALPRTHGSALFGRGETQSLATTTLGTPRDQQKIDGLTDEYFKRFMLHYNFPPFSVGEIRPIRGPSRRDIGHGALAEKSLEAVIPTAEEFPYTIRVVSEILESNGSSSMASVCSASLALMDAGVPLKAPVAGISIGLIREPGRKILLTDIIGEEDFHGDMDFKVAGTHNGITGIQLDMKPPVGLDNATIAETLAQAKQARLFVLAEMAKVIAQPRSQISQYAPRLLIIKIDPEKIGKVIGPGGKTINALSTKYEVTIDVEDDGTVYVAGADAGKAEQARRDIESMTAEVRVGQIYEGKVVNIREFGAFLEIFPGQDGLCHVSELDEKFVKNVADAVKMGDMLRVKVINIDDQGRVKLSRKAAMKEEREGKS